MLEQIVHDTHVKRLIRRVYFQYILNLKSDMGKHVLRIGNIFSAEIETVIIQKGGNPKRVEKTILIGRPAGRSIDRPVNQRQCPKE